MRRGHREGNVNTRYRPTICTFAFVVLQPRHPPWALRSCLPRSSLAVHIPEPAQFLSRAPKTICTWCRWLWPDRRSRWDAVALLNASLNERMLIIYLILILPVRANNVHVDYRVPGWHGDARQVKVVRFHLLKDLLGGT